MADRGRLATFLVDGSERFGAAVGAGLVDLSGRTPYRSLDEAVAAGALSRLVEQAAVLSPDHDLKGIRFLQPLLRPEKIICVGVNYPDRNAEYKDGQDAPSNPSLFPRFLRSFVGHGEPIVRPKVSPQFDYEGEVAIVIGRPGRHIAERDAFDHIVGAMLANEGTVRDWVRHAKFNVTQGKNFDRSGSLGPWLVPVTGEADLADIRLTTRVNGELRQDDRTSRLIFSIRKLVAYISTFTTLVPGDIILTGTPTGAGARFDPPRFLKAGDVVEIEADGLGKLFNTVIDET